jgi:hypothetical protein
MNYDFIAASTVGQLSEFSLVLNNQYSVGGSCACFSHLVVASIASKADA